MAQASSEQIILPESTPDNVPQQVPPKPFPLFGEAAQGFMVAKFVAGQRKVSLNQIYSSHMNFERELYVHSSFGCSICVDFTVSIIPEKPVVYTSTNRLVPRS